MSDHSENPESYTNPDLLSLLLQLLCLHAIICFYTQNDRTDKSHTHITQHNDSTTQGFTFSGDECHIMWCHRIFPGAFDECTASRHGHTVVQFVEAPRYKPEGCRFDSRWCQWNFSLTSSRTMAMGLTQPLTNEYQEYFLVGGGRCVGLTTLPPLCADCLEIWELQPPGTLMAWPGL